MNRVMVRCQVHPHRIAAGIVDGCAVAVVTALTEIGAYVGGER